MKNLIYKITKLALIGALSIYSAYLGLAGFMQKSDGKFDNKKRAIKEIKENGITSEQASAYKLGISEMLYRGISPYTYDFEEKVISFIPSIIQGREELGNVWHGVREDAWRWYLGLSQKHNTFGISDYKPEKSSDDKYYYKINGFLDGLFKNYYDCDSSEAISSLIKSIKINGGSRTIESFDKTMGRFSLFLGEDKKGKYFSYYDKWDLNVPTEKLGAGLFGRTFEIYDRIYYNPETMEVYQENEKTLERVLLEDRK